MVQDGSGEKRDASLKMKWIMPKEMYWLSPQPFLFYEHDGRMRCNDLMAGAETEGGFCERKCPDNANWDKKSKRCKCHDLMMKMVYKPEADDD
jgi:hypothetical protein